MNIVADIGNSQIKIAIDRKDSISRAKTFRLIDFVSVKKYIKSLKYDGKPDLFYSSVLGTSYDKKLIKILNQCFGKIKSRIIRYLIIFYTKRIYFVGAEIQQQRTGIKVMTHIV